MADISLYIHTDLVELLSTDPDPYFDLGLSFSQFESTLDPDDVDVHTCVFSFYCNVDDDITDNADFYLDPNFNEIDISRMGWEENENEDIQQFDADFNSVSDEIDIGDMSGIGWDENEDIRQFDADFNSLSDEIDICDISRMGWDKNEDIQQFDTVFDDEIDIGDISSSVQIRWGGVRTMREMMSSGRRWWMMMRDKCSTYRSPWRSLRRSLSSTPGGWMLILSPKIMSSPTWNGSFF